MKLSIIIVNYNVKYFLEQCLLSLQNAIKTLDCEVIIVDNNSVDGSVEMVKEKFPNHKLIKNNENLGFAKANNIAIKQSTAEYVLLLNPDTVIENDTLIKVCDFMDSHPDAGGLGVKMLNGKGKFLPESKRGIPTPKAAFYKISGISKIFSKSKKFSLYHLGYLDNNETHSIPILSGAFMLLRKSALEKTGLLDESFFMYGEDIDLSYRLLKAGYKNYYYPHTRIIHYKGESTKKHSINYVLMFYKAMIVFTKKHFSPQSASLFSFMIHIAIYLRAFAAILYRVVKRIYLPIADFLLIYSGMFLIKNYWEQNVILANGSHYPDEFVYIVIPSYIIIWILSILYSAGYDYPDKKINALKGVVTGSVIILIIYSLLPEEIRYSRAIILLGTLWAGISVLLIRFIRQIIKFRKINFSENSGKKYLIIGNNEESTRVSELISNTNLNPSEIRIISLENINRIKELIEIYKTDELIFCGKDIPIQNIIDIMTNLDNYNLDYKIAPPESFYIIGSNSINDAEDLYTININSINAPSNRRRKRLLDVLLSLILLILSPLLIFIIKQPLSFLHNIMLVFAGCRTWVGYYEKTNDSFLPKIKKGILSPYDSFSKKPFEKDLLKNLNILYSRNYSIINDLNIILKGLRSLGRK